MNEYRGQISTHGPYKRRPSAERRADRIQGGETHVFASFNRDAKEAIQDYRDDQVRRL